MILFDSFFLLSCHGEATSPDIELKADWFNLLSIKIGSFISMWQTTFGNAMTGQVLNVVQTLGREMHKRGVPVHAALLLALVVAGIAVSSIDPAILENLKQIMSKKYQDWRTDL